MLLAAVTKEFVIQNSIDALSLGLLIVLFALGIALIFGIMQLVNFAHGELIMIGGYALVLLTVLPLPARVPIMMAIVVVFALGMERIAFRPVRGANPTTLLITSFAVSFLLQNLATVIFGSLAKTTNISTTLSESFVVGGILISKLNVLIVCVVAILLGGLGLFLSRTVVGLHMRAAAEDFQVARLLGVRANIVIATAFAISGLLASVASFLLVAQTATVTPTMGLNPVLFAFVATILGGMGSLSGAVLGSFVLGAVTVGLQASLPLELRVYRDAFVFAIVIALLIVRPQGLIVARSVVTRV